MKNGQYIPKYCIKIKVENPFPFLTVNGLKGCTEEMFRIFT